MKVLYKRGKVIFLIHVNGEYYITHLINKTNYKIKDPEMLIKQSYVEEANVDDETYQQIEEVFKHGTHLTKAMGLLS